MAIISECNLEQKIEAVLCISKYMVKKYGFDGAVKRVLEGKTKAKFLYSKNATH